MGMLPGMKQRIEIQSVDAEFYLVENKVQCFQKAACQPINNFLNQL